MLPLQVLGQHPRVSLTDPFVGLLDHPLLDVGQQVRITSMVAHQVAQAELHPRVLVIVAVTVQWALLKLTRTDARNNRPV